MFGQYNEYRRRGARARSGVSSPLGQSSSLANVLNRARTASSPSSPSSPLHRGRDVSPPLSVQRERARDIVREWEENETRGGLSYNNARATEYDDWEREKDRIHSDSQVQKNRRRGNRSSRNSRDRTVEKKRKKLNHASPSYSPSRRFEDLSTRWSTERLSPNARVSPRVSRSSSRELNRSTHTGEKNVSRRVLSPLQTAHSKIVKREALYDEQRWSDVPVLSKPPKRKNRRRGIPKQKIKKNNVDVSAAEANVSIGIMRNGKQNDECMQFTLVDVANEEDTKTDEIPGNDKLNISSNRNSITRKSRDLNQSSERNKGRKNINFEEKVDGDISSETCISKKPLETRRKERKSTSKHNKLSISHKISRESKLNERSMHKATREKSLSHQEKGRKQESKTKHVRSNGQDSPSLEKSEEPLIVPSQVLSGGGNTNSASSLVYQFPLWQRARKNVTLREMRNSNDHSPLSLNENVPSFTTSPATDSPESPPNPKSNSEEVREDTDFTSSLESMSSPPRALAPRARSRGGSKRFRFDTATVNDGEASTNIVTNGKDAGERTGKTRNSEDEDNIIHPEVTRRESGEAEILAQIAEVEMKEALKDAANASHVAKEVKDLMRAEAEADRPKTAERSEKMREMRRRARMKELAVRSNSDEAREERERRELRKLEREKRRNSDELKRSRERQGRTSEDFCGRKSIDSFRKSLERREKQVNEDESSIGSPFRGAIASQRQRWRGRNRSDSVGSNSEGGVQGVSGIELPPPRQSPTFQRGFSSGSEKKGTPRSAASRSAMRMSPERHLGSERRQEFPLWKRAIDNGAASSRAEERADISGEFDRSCGSFSEEMSGLNGGRLSLSLSLRSQWESRDGGGGGNLASSSSINRLDNAARSGLRSSQNRTTRSKATSSPRGIALNSVGPSRNPSRSKSPFLISQQTPRNVMQITGVAVAAAAAAAASRSPARRSRKRSMSTNSESIMDGSNVFSENSLSLSFSRSQMDEKVAVGMNEQLGGIGTDIKMLDPISNHRRGSRKAGKESNDQNGNDEGKVESERNSDVSTSRASHAVPGLRESLAESINSIKEDEVAIEGSSSYIFGNENEDGDVNEFGVLGRMRRIKLGHSSGGSNTGGSNSESASRSKTGGTLLKMSFSDGPNRWRMGEVIGSGTFGRVFKALNEDTGAIFAVKQMRVDSATEQQAVEIEREISLLKGQSHPNIVAYLGTERRGACLHIFLEYIPGGSISAMLSEFGAFPDSVIRQYTRHIVQGVRYLHGRKIIHRDIKGSNILVSDSGIAKLADFGCSKQMAGIRTNRLDESLKTLRGSIPWMAPEVIRQTGHGRKADIWSIGATVLEMATARHPWPSFENNFSALFHVATANKPPPIPEEVSVEVREFLDLCFQMEPENRASAEKLLQSHFCSETNREEKEEIKLW